MSRRRHNGRDFKEPARPAAAAPVTALVSCRNCDRRVAKGTLRGLGCCRYDACAQCWTQWLASNLSEHKSSTINCIGCSHKLTDTELRELMDAPLRQRYERVLFMRAVRDMADFLPCPTARCNGGGWINAKCPADSKEPYSCNVCKKSIAVAPDTLAAAAAATTAGVGLTNTLAAQLTGSGSKRDAKAEREFNANEQWKTSNSQQCPQCRVHTEKNGGCPHMKCSRCGHDYCWFCRGPYYSGGSHSSCDPDSQASARRRQPRAVPETGLARALPIVSGAIVIALAVMAVVCTIYYGFWRSWDVCRQYLSLLYVLCCQFGQPFCAVVCFLVYPFLLGLGILLGLALSNDLAMYTAHHLLFAKWNSKAKGGDGGGDRWLRVNQLRLPSRPGIAEKVAPLWCAALLYLWWYLLWRGTDAAGVQQIADLAAFFAADGRPPVSQHMATPMAFFLCRRFAALTAVFFVGSAYAIGADDIPHVCRFWAALAMQPLKALKSAVKSFAFPAWRSLKRRGRAVRDTLSNCSCCRAKRATRRAAKAGR